MKVGSIVKGGVTYYSIITKVPPNIFGRFTLQTLETVTTFKGGMYLDDLCEPANQELEIVRRHYENQIRAIMEGGEYPPADEPRIKIISETGQIPQDLINKVEGLPEKLAVRVKTTMNYRREPPSTQAMKEELREIGYKNLVWLAEVAGFNGLFQVEVTDFLRFEPKEIWAGLVSMNPVHDRYSINTTAIVQGLAYKLQDTH